MYRTPDHAATPNARIIVHRTLVPLGFFYVTAVALSYFVLGTPSGSTYALTARMLFAWACNQYRLLGSHINQTDVVLPDCSVLHDFVLYSVLIVLCHNQQ